jgi:hypothetical protein
MGKVFLIITEYRGKNFEPSPDDQNKKKFFLIFKSFLNKKNLIWHVWAINFAGFR